MKNYIIIYYDGTKEYVNDKIAEIVGTSPSPRVRVIEGGKTKFLSTTGIKNIISVEEHNRQLSRYSAFDPLRFTPKEPTKRVHALQQMIQGLQKYINSDQNQGTSKPEKMLKLFQLRLLQAQSQLK